MEPNPSHFSDDALKKITAIEGKTLATVICYIWVNKMDPKATVELIDNVELRFTDGSHIVISCNEDVEGLSITDDFDYKEEQARLTAEFGDKIRIVPVDASKTKMWEEVPGKVLDSVGLTKDDSDYLDDSMVLNFGEEKRIISLSPLDGLIIDYYEED
jgi:hypothetical protein